MSSEIAVKVEGLSKCYQIYEQPHDRLKQFVLPKLQRMAGLTHKRYYREFWALKDVSFEVEKGETVGIIGRNGSGKSTLLQMICGTLNPTSGHITAHGRIGALLELGSGFNPEFTGRENVYLNASVLGLSRDETDERFDKIAAFADIGQFIDQPVKTYSSGMVVRLAFAVQANVDPEILIVDEALAVGDAYFVHRCMLRFHELQRNGTTILFVSHDANAIRNLCANALWLDEGGLRRSGDSSKVVDDYLANIFHQQISTKTDGAPKPEELVFADTPVGLPEERLIPNIDRRLGDQSCEIMGVGLYSEAMHPISSTLNDSQIVIRLTVCNNSIIDGDEIVIGYILRNAKGQEIASTNSWIEKKSFGMMPKGQNKTFKVKVNLPILYPGSYSFSLAAGFLNSGGEIIVSDRIENALVFDIISSKQVHVMMSLPTIFEVEA
jgi:lipopolysaccharide transport system ATP-binding protein